MSASVVHLYSIGLDVPASRLDVHWRMLNQEEKQRANRFRFPQLKNRWLVSRAGLKDILSQHCCMSPINLEFDYEQFGKPVLARPATKSNWHFNLSHSHNLALVGITQLAPVGVDLEYERRPVSDWQSVAKRFFSPFEYRQLMTVPEDQRQTAFYNCWTRKEAIIKATGEGLSACLSSFDVSLVPGEPAEVINSQHPGPPGCRWQLIHLNVADDFVGAVALQTSADVAIEDHGMWHIGAADQAINMSDI